MRLTRRHAILGAAAAGVAASVPLVAMPAFADSSTQAAKVYIDPGHGGSDSGAVGNGLEEKEINLDISLQLRDILEGKGVEVRMSRSDDTFVDLDPRAADANDWGADLFVSVHVNSGGGTGFESYRYTDAGSDTVAAHEKLHPAIMESIGDVSDRGMKSANFLVLRKTSMPAILTENLFIDTASDAELLASDEFRAASAEGHAEGIAQILGI